MILLHYFSNKTQNLSLNDFSSNYSNDIIIISKDTIFQVHDKTFKEILKNSIEMTKFLKSFIGLEVNSENLKICNSNFITNDYKRRESDILYKNINKNIFYLVEHQSTINVDMPRRILEYSTEIMRETKKTKLELSNPLIIPIVIYISYMLLIEKCRNHLELAQTLEYIALHVVSADTKEWVNNLVTYVFAKTLDDTSKSKILKLLYEKEKNENMEDLIERINNNIRLEKKKNIKIGKLENLFSTIKNMLNLNYKDEEIKKCTNATQEQIDQVRKKLK